MRVTVTSFFCKVISFLTFLETLIFYDQFSQPVTRKCVLNVEKEICNLELCYPYISHPLSINNLYSCGEPALIVYQFRVSSYLLSFLSCLFMCVINNFALFFFWNPCSQWVAELCQQLQRLCSEELFFIK